MEIRLPFFAQCGTATSSHGQKSEGTSFSECGHNVESLALGRNWELARVALSCHIALDTLRQEMHEAW